MPHEIKATVYETDGWFMSLCNDFPGVTGEGRTREDCIADLTKNIEDHLAEAEARPAVGG